MPESKLEIELEKVRDLNRQLVVVTSEYNDLWKKLGRLGKMIYRRKIRIENLLNREDKK